jgi:hypothetical protein
MDNSEKEPLELKVDHYVEMREHHSLIGTCSACGEEIATRDPGAIKQYEQGLTTGAQCRCGQRYRVPGRSKLVKPKDIGRVVVPGTVNNRHRRRASLKIVE